VALRIRTREELGFQPPDEARTHAELIATELAPDGIWQDAWLYVVDEENQEIARIQVSRP
jgi:hypothetical protein